MQSFVIAAALISVAGLTMAEPSCSMPKEKWMLEAAFKKSVEAQGYAIKTFKVNKGQCYEVYGEKRRPERRALVQPGSSGGSSVRATRVSLISFPRQRV
jgi:hypothetical protein